MSKTIITEPSILIRVSQTYSARLTAEGVYEITRGVWKIGKRRDTVEYALTVVNGIVKEVFEIIAWFPAGTTTYKTRPLIDVAIDGRWEFIGRVANDTIRKKYIEQSVAHYFSRGAVNPITYLNA